MKTKLIILALVAMASVIMTGCEIEEPLEPRHDALPKISEDILGLSPKQAEKILKANGFIESDEAHAPKYSSHLATYSLNPDRVYSNIKYYVRGQKNAPERDYDYDEWITVGFRDNTLHAFRSMLFPNTTTQGLDEFRTWSDFAWNTACSNPYFWSAYLYYASGDSRNISFAVDSIYHHNKGSRAEYEEAKAEMTDDLVEVFDDYLRYEKPRAVSVSFQRYNGQLYLRYDAEYTATCFWGPDLDGGDGPGSSTVEPTDPNQNPSLNLWCPHKAYQRTKISFDRELR